MNKEYNSTRKMIAEPKKYYLNGGLSEGKEIPCGNGTALLIGGNALRPR